MLDFLRAIAERISREPVLLRSVAGGIIAAAAIFGVTLQDDALDPLIDLLGLLAGILVGASARSKATPTASPIVPAGTEVRIEGTDRSIVVGPLG
jgi:hypothetical protein